MSDNERLEAEREHGLGDSHQTPPRCPHCGKQECPGAVQTEYPRCSAPANQYMNTELACLRAQVEALQGITVKEIIRTPTATCHWCGGDFQSWIEAYDHAAVCDHHPAVIEATRLLAQVEALKAPGVYFDWRCLHCDAITHGDKAAKDHDSTCPRHPAVSRARDAEEHREGWKREAQIQAGMVATEKYRADVAEQRAKEAEEKIARLHRTESEQITGLRNKCAEQKVRADIAEAKLDDLHAMMIGLVCKDTLDQAEAERDDAVTALGLAKQTIRMLEERVKKSESDCESRSARDWATHIASSEVFHAPTPVVSPEDALRRLRADAMRLRAEQAETALKKASDAVSYFTKRTAELESERNRLSEGVEHWQLKTSQASNEAAELRAERDRYKARLMASTTEREDLRRVAGEDAGTIARLARERDDMTARAEKAEKAEQAWYNNQRSACKGWDEDYVEYCKEVARLKISIGELRAALLTVADGIDLGIRKLRESGWHPGRMPELADAARRAAGEDWTAQQS